MEIQAKGVVTGEIHAPCLVIEPGGIFDGRCHMLAASESTKPLTIPIRVGSITDGRCTGSRNSPRFLFCKIPINIQPHGHDHTRNCGRADRKALFAGRDVPACVTHGALTAAQSSPTARAAIVACTLGSIFPDIDIFAGPLARQSAGDHGVAPQYHAFAGAAAGVGVCLAAVSLPLARWLRWETPPFCELFVIYAVGLATHVFLDVVTSFGTMVWSPLRYSRPAWDWVFILDLTLTALALVPQLAAWCYREPRKFRPRVRCASGRVLTGGAFGAYVLAALAGYPISDRGRRQS